MMMIREVAVLLLVVSITLINSVESDDSYESRLCRKIVVDGDVLKREVEQSDPCGGQCEGYADQCTSCGGGDYVCSFPGDVCCGCDDTGFCGTCRNYADCTGDLHVCRTTPTPTPPAPRPSPSPSDNSSTVMMIVLGVTGFGVLLLCATIPSCTKSSGYSTSLSSPAKSYNYLDTNYHAGGYTAEIDTNTYNAGGGFKIDTTTNTYKAGGGSKISNTSNNTSSTTSSNTRTKNTYKAGGGSKISTIPNSSSTNTNISGGNRSSSTYNAGGGSKINSNTTTNTYKAGGGSKISSNTSTYTSSSTSRSTNTYQAGGGGRITSGSNTYKAGGGRKI